MKKALKARTTKSKKKNKKTSKSLKSNRRRSPKLPTRAKPLQDKDKLLKKHIMANKIAELECDKQQNQICKNDIKMQTTSQQQVVEKDTNDQLLRSFNVAARDSPSLRCNNWIQNMPHSSVWEKGHTLSGHDLANIHGKRRLQQQSQHKVENNTSQRGLTLQTSAASPGRLKMQRSNDERSYKGGKMSKYEEREASNARSRSRRRQKQISRQQRSKSRLQAKKHKEMKKNKRGVRESQEGEITDDTVTLKRKAKKIVRRVWSRAENSKKPIYNQMRTNSSLNALPQLSKGQKRSKTKRNIKMRAIKEAFKAHKKKLTNFGRKSSYRLAKRNDKTRRSGISPEKELELNTSACMKISSGRRKRNKHERRREKMTGGMRRKTRKRPHSQQSEKIYSRKHRPGLYLTQEKSTPSLGWAILQSIKLLEKKGIANPTAILKNVRRKWGCKNATLKKIRQALKWMERKGILHSDTVRKRENGSTSDRHRKDKRLSQRESFIEDQNEFELDGSITSLDYEVEEKKKPPMKVRFQHKSKDFTSVRSRKYRDDDVYL